MNFRYVIFSLGIIFLSDCVYAQEKSKIIIINGSSSAGKSSIIAQMQKISQKPLFSTGIDHVWLMVPEQYTQFGEKADEGYAFVKGVDEYDNPVVLIEVGPLCEYVDKAMVRIITSLADSGIDVVVDSVITDKRMIEEYAQQFAGYTVYFIGVTCDLPELERREKSRGDRVLGLARGLVDVAHMHCKYYDFIVDSTHNSSSFCAAEIMRFIQENPEPHGFVRLADSLRN